MTIERKVGMGIAGQPSGATDVADVFSIDLWDNVGSSNTINSGLDSTDSDVMIWAKQRDGTGDNFLVDTVRGITKYLRTNNANMESTNSSVFASTSSTGYAVGSILGGSTQSYVGWQFKKQKKFFDIVTYSGNSVNGRQISHSLDSPVGMMIVKRTNANGMGWQTYHRSAKYSTNTGYYNTNNAGSSVFGLSSSGGVNSGSSSWNNTDATSTHFTLGTSAATNQTGGTYVAYLFADNSTEDAEDQIIKCGYYQGNGPDFGTDGHGPIVNLGWEPQWILIKNTANVNWVLIDSMRRATVANPDLYISGMSSVLHPNLNNAAQDVVDQIKFTPTGFEIMSPSDSRVNAGPEAEAFIYMAIRAPMMVEPTAATEVFEVDQAPNSNNPRYVAPFPIDMGMARRITGDAGLTISSRQTMGLHMRIDNNSAELADSRVKMDFSNGWDTDGDTATTHYSWMWKRAKGFFDVVCYDGTGSNRTVPHSLGVVPEMIWVKKRNGTNGWQVYTAEGAGSSYLTLSENYNYSTNNTRFNNTAATSSVFTVGTSATVNSSNSKVYIAYLFATLDGISKVGTYTGNGSSQTINCGFSAGARFVLIKRANLSVSGNEGDWFMWDSLNGIVAGNDPHLSINTGTAQVATDDSVDPANSGFIVNQVSATNINVSSSTYIFYAIA